jgi:hypothetical protein
MEQQQQREEEERAREKQECQRVAHLKKEIQEKQAALEVFLIRKSKPLWRYF